MLLLFIISLVAAKFEFDNFSELKRCNSNLDGGPTVPDETMKLMLDEMLDNNKYDRRIRPYFDEDKPVRVGINIYVASMDDISEVNMDYGMTVYFMQTWTDPRLRLDPDGKYGPAGWLDNCSISLATSIENDIWTPDVYFVNEKISFKHTVTMQNAMFRLLPEGRVVYSVRITMQVSCLMELSRYPLDKQVCSLKMESYSHDQSELQIYMMDEETTNSSVNGVYDLSLQQFVVENASIVTKLHSQHGFENQRITLNFMLQRRIMYFVLQSYVPCTLITILSWVSFWINYEATAARVSLGITTVMTMTTLYTHVSRGMPKIPDLKALDVFMLACFVFVFMALLEYAFVNYSYYGAVPKKYKKEKPVELDRLQRTVKNTTVRRSFGVQSPALRRRSTIQSRRGCFKLDLNSFKINDVSQIDKFSRRLFPASFLMFNLIYWTYYKLWTVSDSEQRYQYYKSIRNYDL